MNTALFLPLIVGFALIPWTSAAFDPDLICTLVVSGTKINDPRACNAWIQCVDGQPVSSTCATGLFYDRQSQSCVASNSVKCVSSDPCASIPNGFAADPYSCNDYYYCKKGVGSLGTCGTGMNFNPGTNDCIRDLPCQEKMDPDSLCNILPDGVFIKSTNSCNGYQQCWKSAVVNATCPGTFYFSAAQGECVYPQSEDCPFTVSPDIAKEGVCSQNGAFVSDETTCNGYYLCHELSNGQMELVHGVCSDDRFFVPTDGGACVPRSKVSCPYDRCAGLGAATIQLANESNDGCHGYSICQDGTSIGGGTCPNDEYFDEVTQRCTTQVISYPACQSSAETTTQVDWQTMMNDDATTTNTSGA